MIWLFDQVGYVGRPGLSRLIVWMPLLLFLVHRLPQIPVRTPTGLRVGVLLATNGVSPISDSLDVIRNLLGGTT